MSSVDTVMQIVNDPDATVRDITARLLNIDSWDVDDRRDDDDQA